MREKEEGGGEGKETVTIVSYPINIFYLIIELICLSTCILYRFDRRLGWRPGLAACITEDGNRQWQ